MKYNNKHFLLIIFILLVIIYLLKTTENYTSLSNITKNNISYNCLTEDMINDLQKDIYNLENIYDEFQSIDKKNISVIKLDLYKKQFKNAIYNLLDTCKQITSTQLSCLMNNKNQIELLNKIYNILNQNKEKLRIIKKTLILDFKNITSELDILPSIKNMEINRLNTFSNLFNTISYIFNDNDEYTLNYNGDKSNSNTDNLLKHPRTCNFICKHNNHYKDPKSDEPQYKILEKIKF
jgi:hypothetical protein